MAGISGSRTLSPDVLEAIRTKSYVLRPVVKVCIILFLKLNKEKISDQPRSGKQIFLEIWKKKNLFFCDDLLWIWWNHIENPSSRSNTPREEKRDLQSPPFLLGGLPWGELVLIIHCWSLIPNLSSKLIIKVALVMIIWRWPSWW